ncbi:MAG: DNA repair protein RecN [Rickettsiaceae bacterium]|nr:DNA repair protein RecN [Rickettsiaceae bacterium]
MLNRLYIKNFVIIREIDIEIQNGLSCVTGETGSGKSLILDAMEFCMYGSGNSNIIRPSEEFAQVSMTFDLDPEISSIIADSGIIVEDAELSIMRIIYSSGKKRCFLNNQPVTQKILDLVSEKLISIYAQSAFSELFKTSYHMDFLDNFIPNKDLLDDVIAISKNIKTTEGQIIEKRLKKEAQARELDYLKHMLFELESAKIQENELDELTSKKLNAKKIAKKVELISDALTNIKNASIIDTLASILRRLTRTENSEIFDSITKDLDEAISKIAEAESKLESLIENEMTDDDIEKIEERLYLIKNLLKKYNLDENDVGQKIEQLRSDIANYDDIDNNLTTLSSNLELLKKQYTDKALKLSSERYIISRQITEKVNTELGELYMQNCKFNVQVQTQDNDNYGPRGLDVVRFEASINPGSPLMPIDKIASGGEMARLMLALQITLLASSSRMPLIVFDEIDTGVGGRVADSVGEKLKKLSTLCKVIVITHQPQVASKAGHHILVTKKTYDNHTESSAVILNHEQKTKEIARMLSGKIITEEAISAAKKLVI